MTMERVDVLHRKIPHGDRDDGGTDPGVQYEGLGDRKPDPGRGVPVTEIEDGQ